MTAPDPARPAPWTPDQPLRSDATWDKIAEREGWLEIHRHTGLSRTIADVAFEYAIACVADREALNVRLLHEQDTEIVRLRAELAALLPGSRHADAARPASEREALATLILAHGGCHRVSNYEMADALLRAGWRRDGGEDTPMPTRWYCSSCGEVEDCTTQYGEVVCKYKHIVATFFPALSAGRPIPTEEK